MKKISILLYLVIAISFMACEEILDLKVDSTFGDEFTWTLPDKAEGVLMNAYANIPNAWDSWGGNFLDVATDNALTNNYSSALFRVGAGGLSHLDNPIGSWGNAYSQFRNIHLFLENGLNDSLVYIMSDSTRNETVKRRLKGEAFFLRAWWGMELLRAYGGLSNDGEALGYVIITRNLSDADLEELGNAKRNTYEECVAQIVADCDTAIALLPLEYKGSDVDLGASSIGRASGKAAWALKSRVLTFAASPAFQSQGISEQEIIQKWQRAAKASYDAIVEGELGAYTSLKDANFNNIATTPPEFLFRRFTNNRTLEERNYPAFFNGEARTQPSQNLVDAFPAANGYPINDSRSEYDPQDPFKNRDKRLDLTVYYNGRTFDGRPLEIYFDENSGLFGKDAEGSDYRNTRTGYYLRKWLSEKSNLLDNIEPQNDRHMHVMLRKSEVFFNLAEALNEVAGPLNTLIETGAYTAASIIGEARIQAIGLSSDPYLDEIAAGGTVAFRAFIQNERRVEFAFENHRYFDMRRWLLPLNESVKGYKAIKTDNGIVYKGTNPADNNDAVIVEERKLNDPKFYYIPLPYGDLVKNEKLVDNKGWSFK